MAGTASKRSVVDQAKELLADPRHRIALDDFVNEHLRTTLAALGTDHFPVSGGGGNQAFVDRVAAYEAALKDLLPIVVLLARWADSEGQLQLEKIFLRLAEDAGKEGGGSTLWLALRWYPILLLIYAGTISALSARRYDALPLMLTPRVQRSSRIHPLAYTALGAAGDIGEGFKVLPGLSQHRYARSDHFFALLREPLDGLLFLGTSYEDLFDRCEVLLALTYADHRDPSGREVWGPPGRYVAKQEYSNGPLDAIIEEAKAAGDRWPLLTSGLFGASSERFVRVAEGLRKRFSGV